MKLFEARAIISFALLIASPIATYYAAQNGLKEDIRQVEMRSVQTFVRKDELKPINDKLDKLVVDVAEVKGYLKGKAGKRYSDGSKPLDLSASRASLNW